jgi:hypothetical protein
MTVSKVDELIAAFPQQPTRIEGQPTYATIAELKETLKINAASIPCTLGGAAHGYLGVIVSETMYATYSDTPFVAPVAPPPQAIIPAQATAAQITEAHRQHDAAQNLFREYVNVQAALKKLIIDNVEKTYLRATRSGDLGRIPQQEDST